MIYITGDTHGNPTRVSTESLPHSSLWTKKDTLIVCGDFGYLFSGSSQEERLLRELAARPYTIAFVDGAHENYQLLDAYPPVRWNGGIAKKIRRNIFHMTRGQIFKIEGHKLFAMGGGYTADRARRDEGLDWWPQEMPSSWEYKQAINNLDRYDRKVDYIITHAAPETVMRPLSGDYEGEKELNDFLQWVKNNVTYRKWYFGRLHMDVEMEDNLYAMFLSVRELTTGELVL